LVENLYIPHIEELEQRLIFFYTNIQRKASDIQGNHIKAIEDNEIADILHAIKAIGLQSKTALEEGNFDSFGRLLHEHWKFKHSIRRSVSTTQIDIWYQIGIDCGAEGGKLIGAGGGGFLMFYCPNGKDQVREMMIREGLKELSIRFEPMGSRIILHL
jgi:D-glycero-alpha-D-manno-heptose-7-phosphate kinase